MKVELVGFSQMVNVHGDPMSLAELAASVCYDSKPTQNCSIVKQCIASGHMSVLEHVSFTFHIEGISRACLAQLSRHRHISLSVRSQRYCREDNFQYVNPFPEGSFGAAEFEDYMEEARANYVDMVDAGVAPEDARAVLPNACCTELYMTANARALIEMSHLRMCNRAQREIRELFEKIRNCFLYFSPVMTQNMVPACQAHGDVPFCTEHNGCGLYPKFSELVGQQEDEGDEDDDSLEDYFDDVDLFGEDDEDDDDLDDDLFDEDDDDEDYYD